MRKITGLLVAFIVFQIQARAQEDFKFMKLKDEKIAELPTNEKFLVIEDRFESLPLNTRYDLIGYKPLKFDEFQVISSHQPNSNFDIVYFIDKNGNTTKRIYTTTSPHNFYPSGMADFDSMNPYGSADLSSAIINGFLSTIFRQGFGLR